MSLSDQQLRHLRVVALILWLIGISAGLFAETVIPGENGTLVAKWGLRVASSIAVFAIWVISSVLDRRRKAEAGIGHGVEEVG